MSKYLSLFLFFVFFNTNADNAYYEIKNIEIKQEAEDSLSAKKEALLLSAKKAFEKLFLKREFVEYQDALIEITDEQVQNCVFGYLIEDEKFSDSFYIARFTYRFSKEKIYQLLETFGYKLRQNNQSKAKFTIVIYLEDFIKKISNTIIEKISIKRFSSNKMIIETTDINAINNANIEYEEV